MPPPSGPRMVLIDDATGLPIFGTGSGAGGTGGAGSGPGSAAAPNEVNLRSSTIALPVDVQALYRVQSILTTAALAANGVYTSGAVDGINFRRITGKVFSDVAGSLYIQQSDDGTTWDNASVVTVAAGAAPFYDVVMYARYVRFYYVNGATLQGVFRLSGYLAVQ